MRVIPVARMGLAVRAAQGAWRFPCSWWGRQSEGKHLSKGSLFTAALGAFTFGSCQRRVVGEYCLSCSVMV